MIVDIFPGTDQPAHGVNIISVTYAPKVLGSTPGMDTSSAIVAQVATKHVCRWVHSASG